MEALFRARPHTELNPDEVVALASARSQGTEVSFGDKTLKVGPYNFGFANSRPDWVEHYAYQNGLLIWKWDTSQVDNNTSQHKGTGLVLPID